MEEKKKHSFCIVSIATSVPVFELDTPESLSFRRSLKCKLNAYFQPKTK